MQDLEQAQEAKGQVEQYGWGGEAEDDLQELEEALRESKDEAASLRRQLEQLEKVSGALTLDPLSFA